MTSRQRHQYRRSLKRCRQRTKRVQSLSNINHVQRLATKTPHHGPRSHRRRAECRTEAGTELRSLRRHAGTVRSHGGAVFRGKSTGNDATRQRRRQRVKKRCKIRKQSTARQCRMARRRGTRISRTLRRPATRIRPRQRRRTHDSHGRPHRDVEREQPAGVHRAGGIIARILVQICAALSRVGAQNPPVLALYQRQPSSYMPVTGSSCMPAKKRSFPTADVLPVSVQLAL